MSNNFNEIKQVAAQLLAGMLANPHIYATTSDEGANGRQEQELIALAIDMASSLIRRVEQNHG